MRSFVFWLAWSIVVSNGYMFAGRLLALGHPGWGGALIVASAALLAMPLCAIFRLERKVRDQDWPAP